MGKKAKRKKVLKHELSNNSYKAEMDFILMEEEKMCREKAILLKLLNLSQMLHKLNRIGFIE